MNNTTGATHAWQLFQHVAAGIGFAMFLVFLPGARTAAGQMPCCSGSGCCGMPGAVCTLSYGASGTVTDAVSGMPIAGARITVLDVSTSSAADGSFAVSGAHSDTCNLDYYVAISVTATGYAAYDSSLYTSSPAFSNLHVQLTPLQSPTPTVCPVETPCPLGEHPRSCTPDPCGLGCGCESCPPCGDGEVPSHEYNHCRCIPGNGDATPTPTPHAPTPTATPTMTPTAADIVCGTVCDGAPCTRRCLDGFVSSGVCTLTVVNTDGDPIGCGCEASCAHGCAPDCDEVCVGDCDRDGAVTVEELVMMVNIALGTTNIFSSCLAADTDADQHVQVTEILMAVNRALSGCGGPESGACYESSSCDPSNTYPSAAFGSTRGRCCELQRSGGGVPFTFCPAAAFDPVTTVCTRCLNPC